MTEAQRSLLRVLDKLDPRSITLRDVRRHRLEADFKRARRAGLIVSAGYETSAQADDWLNHRAPSPED